MDILPQNRMLDFLNERISFCEEQQQVLQADSRSDEAKFEKIKVNVYEIFKTMLAVAVKKSGKDDSAIGEFIKAKLKEIPSSWVVSYEKAAQHEDAEKMHIEKIKLDAAQEIKEAALGIWG